MITLIALCDKNMVIGQEGYKPPYQSAHARLVRKQTKGKSVLMGRKTFEAMGAGFSDSDTYVLTENLNWSHEGVTPVLNLDGFLLKTLIEKKEKEVVVFGGAETFALAWPWAETHYLTKAHMLFYGEKKFPPFPFYWSSLYLEDSPHLKNQHENDVDGEVLIEQLHYRRHPGQPYYLKTQQDAATFAILKEAHRIQGWRLPEQADL